MWAGIYTQTHMDDVGSSWHGRNKKCQYHSPKHTCAVPQERYLWKLPATSHLLASNQLILWMRLEGDSSKSKGPIRSTEEGAYKGFRVRMPGQSLKIPYKGGRTDWPRRARTRVSDLACLWFMLFCSSWSVSASPACLSPQLRCLSHDRVHSLWFWACTHTHSHIYIYMHADTAGSIISGPHFTQ